MCGIAGILTLNESLDLQPIAAAMLGALRDRGPDDEGSVELGLANGFRLLLVHTRLSILDLSPAGHQPMHDRASDSWIVYNGEVYNHLQVRCGLADARFESSCDTETVLKAWSERGPNCLSAMRGMFAFAMYDRRRRQLWLVRDRLGIKPLYVCQASPNVLLFASELRTLLASGLIARRLNPAAIRSYLAFGAVSAPWTLVEGVQCLLPGETWKIDLEPKQKAIVPQSARYWSPPFVANQSQMPYRDAVEQIRPVLLEALSLHMVSDVPVGVFLSGGIDSSSIVASLSHLGHHVKTFSVWFGEQGFDESVYARRVAAMFGTEHIELHMPPKKVFAHLDAAMASYDQPSIDGLNTFFISQAVHQAGIKVAMSGLGGDELFAGYSSFRLASMLDRPLYRNLARVLYQVMHRYAPNTIRTNKLATILGCNRSRLMTYAVFRQVMLAQRRAELLQSDAHDDPPLPPSLVHELTSAIGRLDAPNAYSFLELSLYLANMLLRDTDQMSMAHSLEVRVPLLDHRLVEIVGGIPGSLKLAGSQPASKKRLLLDALAAPLPRTLVRRRKMGFVFPWEQWLRQDLSKVVSCVFSDWEAAEAVGINADAVGRLWTQFLARRPGIRYTDILSLMHLLTWVRANKLRL